MNLFDIASLLLAIIPWFLPDAPWYVKLIISLVLVGMAIISKVGISSNAIMWLAMHIGAALGAWAGYLAWYHIYWYQLIGGVFGLSFAISVGLGLIFGGTIGITLVLAIISRN